MNTRDWFSDIQKSFENDWEYQGEFASTLFTEKILEYLEKNDISKKKLAELLDTSPAYVSKILNGGGNFTFKKIYQICIALQLDFMWQIKPKPTLAIMQTIKDKNQDYESVTGIFYNQTTVIQKEKEMVTTDG